MSSIISDSLDFKWDTEHLNCGTEERPAQVIYSQPQPVYYPQPQQPVVINSNSKNENPIINLIRFIVVLAFIGLIVYFICGGNPDVLVSYINSFVHKISEVLGNVQI